MSNVIPEILHKPTLTVERNFNLELKSYLKELQLVKSY